MKNFIPFHAFFYVNDLQKSVHFYSQVLGCPLKFSNETSFTIDFFGHGLSFERPAQGFELGQLLTCSASDVNERQYVPSMHWGINLYDRNILEEILNRLKANSVEYVVKPTLYNEGQPNEQFLFFIKDPTGYVLEFRYMARKFKVEEIEQWDQRSDGHKRKVE
jgi:extradiol dioxygenase family protein